MAAKLARPVHQAASCVCSPARSTIYTGRHIQQTGVFDNAGFLWQPDMATSVKTVGHRLADLGYHAAYQGKWHLSGNLDQAQQAVDARDLVMAMNAVLQARIAEEVGVDDGAFLPIRNGRMVFPPVG